MTKDDITFAKNGRVAATKEWLGSGIFSQLNPDKHAAARAVLNPSFRRDYLCRLDSFMVASALDFTHILTAAAAASAVTSAGAGSRAGDGAGAVVGAAGAAGALDMQRLFRLCTLDTIGLTSLNKSFDVLKLWSQQQQQQPAHSSSSSSGGQLQLEQLLWDLESAFLWQSLLLPVPSESQRKLCCAFVMHPLFLFRTSLCVLCCAVLRCHGMSSCCMYTVGPP